MNAAPTLLARAGIVAVAFIIAWRILQVNAVLYEDTGRPRLPAPRSGALGGADAETEALARVLRANPAQVAALLVMGREAEAQSRPEAARRAYEAAYQLAPLDREVLAANAEFLLRQGEVSGALALFDRLAEAFPEARERVFPVLGEILASPEHAAAWNAVVARKPAWLGPFLAASCARGVEPSLLVPLFLMRVKEGQAAPAEAACLVEQLRKAERWDEAYQVWLNTLPRDRLSDVGFVYNGSFECAPSGMGFDWVLSRRPERETGFSVEIAQAAGAVGKRALRVSYAARRQAGSPLMQYLALRPGRYELSGFGRPSGITTGRGVHWTLRCVSAGKPQAAIAASERFVGSSEWRRFMFDITVPEACRGQLLQLEPVGVEEGPAFVSGTVWFDDLVLRRIG